MPLPGRSSIEVDVIEVLKRIDMIKKKMFCFY